MAETYPFHYRENGEPCQWSGTERSADRATCPSGCDSSRYHYANDGHPECAEE